MWILKAKISHNCIIGNRCKKFKCTSYSMPISTWQEGNYSYTSHIHTIEGPPKNVNAFIINLKKDKEVIKMEVSKNTIFCIQRRKTTDVITAHFNPKIFMVKPVYVTSEGYEYCEFGSWKKEILIQFLQGMKSNKNMKIVVERFQNTKLDTIIFPKVMPRLSERQREAFQIAVQKRYYTFPRKLELKELARIMKVSVSTYQEHLRRAEEKIMPSFI